MDKGEDPMACFLLVGRYPVDEESDVGPVIIAETPERAAALAGGEFAGAAEHGGWLVAYERALFHEPAPEERSRYINDEENDTVFFIFRKGPVEVLLDPTENVTHLRLIERPLITE